MARLLGGPTITQLPIDCSVNNYKFIWLAGRPSPPQTEVTMQCNFESRRRRYKQCQNGDLPRNYPFSCALQKETDNDKSRLVQMLALLRCRSASSCQSNKSQREGRREVDRKNRSRGQFYAEVEKEGGREGEVELEIGFL